MREYNAAFGYGSAPKNDTGFTNEKLVRDIILVQEKSLNIISNLSDEDLKEPLIEAKTPHPVASTKGEAIDWNIKHNMWHVGQMATLVRILGERIKFR